MTQAPVIMESAKRKKGMERNIPNAIVTKGGRENIATRKVINEINILYIYSSCGTYYSVYSMLALNAIVHLICFSMPFSCLHCVYLLSIFVWTLNESAILHSDTMFEFPLDSKNYIISWAFYLNLLCIFTYQQCVKTLSLSLRPLSCTYKEMLHLFAWPIKLDEVRVVKCFM